MVVIKMEPDVIDGTSVHFVEETNNGETDASEPVFGLKSAIFMNKDITKIIIISDSLQVLQTKCPKSRS